MGREEGADGSRGCGGDSDDFDLAVAQLSTCITVIVTQVTLVELGEGVGWAHISWVFMIAQGSIESIVI